MCLFIETLLIKKGAPRSIGYHQRRVDKTTKKHFGTSMIDLQKELLNPPEDRIYRCRITYSKRVEKIEYLPYDLVKRVKIKAVETDLDYNYKYSDRENMEKLFSIAKKEGFDDVLFIRNGFVTDTSVSNVAFFDGNSWLTPTFPLLAGTVRARLIESGFLKRASISIEELGKFSLFALFNSLSGFYIAGSVKNIIREGEASAYSKSS